MSEVDTERTAPALSDFFNDEGNLVDELPEADESNVVEGEEVENLPVQTKPAPPPQDEEPKYKVKVDGVEQEVPLSELIKGYARQDVMTKRTQELAEQRQQVSEAMAQLTQHAQVIAADNFNIEKRAAELIQFLQTKSFDDDPYEVGKAQNELTRLNMQYQSNQMKLNEFNQVRQHQAKNIQEELINTGKVQLMKDWNVTDHEEYSNRIIETSKSIAEEYGFDPGEINEVLDYRAWKVMHDAMQWRKLQKSKTQVVQKVKSTPPKVERPGTSRAVGEDFDDKFASVQKAAKKGDQKAVRTSLEMLVEKAGW